MNAVVTLTLGKDYEEQADITHPSIKQYAVKIGANFIDIRDQKIATYPYFEKFRLHEILEQYERVIFFDTDVIIRKDCPNLFNMVPFEKLGMYDEFALANIDERLVQIQMVDQAMYEYFGEPLSCELTRFFNTGVTVASNIHQSLFVKPKKEILMPYLDQAYLNALFVRENTPIFDIGYHFNRMYYVDKAVRPHRLRSCIIHYAGVRNFDNQARADLMCWTLAEED